MEPCCCIVKQLMWWIYVVLNHFMSLLPTLSEADVLNVRDNSCQCQLTSLNCTEEITECKHNRVWCCRKLEVEHFFGLL